MIAGHPIKNKMVPQKVLFAGRPIKNKMVQQKVILAGLPIRIIMVPEKVFRTDQSVTVIIQVNFLLYQPQKTHLSYHTQFFRQQNQNLGKFLYRDKFVELPQSTVLNE